MFNSNHANERVQQRIKREKRLWDTPQVCQQLWDCGRAAVPTDFQRFAMRQDPDCEYRVAVAYGDVWMVVRGKRIKQFVTVVKLKR